MSNERRQIGSDDSSLFEDVQMQKLLKHVPREQIPGSADLCSSSELAESFEVFGDAPLSLIAVGDIMLGGHAKEVIEQRGADHPFEAVLPLLRRGTIVLGNLEGPLARKSKKENRNYIYKVNPRLARVLRRAGFNVLTLANNHALDCGREGVLETLHAVSRAGIAAIGAGADEEAAHAPFILKADRWWVGLLGYYWNDRCAAAPNLPGVAIDSLEALEADIIRLRKDVDRVVVTFHWGVPYVREPAEDVKARARFAVECGADAVIGHHPHIVQPFEVHKGSAIFYSLGNFTFGSRNSLAEGLVLGIRFEERRTITYLHPIYVKNRDPRVDYQPKVLRGSAAERALRFLADISGPFGKEMRIERGRGVLVVDRASVRGGAIDGPEPDAQPRGGIDVDPGRKAQTGR